MYETIEEAKLKLESSLVLFDGQPVYVSGVVAMGKDFGLQYTSLPFKKKKHPWNLPPGVANPETVYETVSIKDPRWDFKSGNSRLGYVSLKNPNDGSIEAAFTSRMPSRHPRQGLDNRTVNVKLFSDSPWPIDFNTLLESEGLSDTFSGRYASATAAFDLVTKTPDVYHSVPISRKLLLHWDRVSPPVLVYRNEKVGYTEDGEKYRLAEHKQFLSEELQDIEGLKLVVSPREGRRLA